RRHAVLGDPPRAGHQGRHGAVYEGRTGEVRPRRPAGVAARRHATDPRVGGLFSLVGPRANRHADATPGLVAPWFGKPPVAEQPTFPAVSDFLPSCTPLSRTHARRRVGIRVASGGCKM